MADDGTRVAFDREQFKKVQALVENVAITNDDALHGSAGHSIGSDLRAQPVAARWDVAMQVGTDVSALAGQVRTFTETFVEKTLPQYQQQLQKAEQLFEETDDLTTSTASGAGTGIGPGTGAGTGTGTA